MPSHNETSHRAPFTILLIHCKNYFARSSVQLSPLADCVFRGRVLGALGTIQQSSSSSLFCRGPCEQSWHGQGFPLFDIVYAAFPLLTTASPTLHGVLKDGFGEAVMACDMSEPCKFLSFDPSLQHPVDPFRDTILEMFPHSASQ